MEALRLVVSDLPGDDFVLLDRESRFAHEAGVDLGREAREERARAEPVSRPARVVVLAERREEPAAQFEPRMDAAEEPEGYMAITRTLSNRLYAWHEDYGLKRWIARHGGHGLVYIYIYIYIYFRLR